MPHIVIEYSDNLTDDIQKSRLMKKVHQIVQDSQLFVPEAIKARSLGYSDYVLPEGIKSFIHIRISILEGRSLEQRLALSKSAYSMAFNSVISVDKISVDIHEMKKETYTKTLSTVS